MEGTKRRVWPDSATAVARYSRKGIPVPEDVGDSDSAGPSIMRRCLDAIARRSHKLLGRRRPNLAAQKKVHPRLSRASDRPVPGRRMKPRRVLSDAEVLTDESFDHITIASGKPAHPVQDRGTPGLVPSPGRVRDRRKAGKLPVDPLEGKMEEEMVRLHQTVVSSLQQSAHMLILFTGSLKGEGASTVAREFATVSATRFRKKTLLFDADWRQGALGRLSRRTDPVAVDRVVREGISLERALACVKRPHLFACHLSGNCEFWPDLYDLPAMKHVWGALRESFDVVVVDAPPASDHLDTAIIAKDMDGVIFVLKADSTKWPVAMAAKQRIADNGGKLLGMVLNDRRFYIPKPIYRHL